MKGLQLIKLLLWLGLVVALVAPFTFLEPNKQSDIFNSKQDSNTDIIGDVDSDLRHNHKAKPTVVKVIEKPLHDVMLPDFSTISDIPTKKQQFFDFIRPAIVQQNERILETRVELEYWLEQITLEHGLSEEQELKLQKLVKTYRVRKSSSSLQQINELLVRVDIIPLSLVLVQAANESAWGTSRFARIGLNFFGIWCYEPNCGMVPNGRNEGAKHEVAAFDSLDDAVQGYFKNINTHNAYMVFRTIRAQLRANNEPFSAEILATGLLAYSERGADYVLDITDMLRHNQDYFAYESKEAHYSD
jgi:Bax protein